MSKLLHITLIPLVIALLGACSIAQPQSTPTAQIVIVTPTSLPFPRLDSAPMLNARAAANTGDFSYAGITHHRDQTGTIFLGELRNETQLVQAYVRIELNILDGTGNLIKKSTARLPLHYLYPEEVAPFKIMFPGMNDMPPDGWLSVKVLSTPLSETDRLDYSHTAVSISSAKMSIDALSAWPIVSGVIVNDTYNNFLEPLVLVTCYDASGGVIGINQPIVETNEMGHLLARTSGDFVGVETNLKDELASYRIQIEAKKEF